MACAVYFGARQSIRSLFGHTFTSHLKSSYVLVRKQHTIPLPAEGQQIQPRDLQDVSRVLIYKHVGVTNQ